MGFLSFVTIVSKRAVDSCVSLVLISCLASASFVHSCLPSISVSSSLGMPLSLCLAADACEFAQTNVAATIGLRVVFASSEASSRSFFFQVSNLTEVVFTI